MPRLTAPADVRLVDHDERRLIYQAAQGERFTLTIIAPDIIRLAFYPEGAPRLARTWLYADAQGDVPRQGRPRGDFSHWPAPTIQMQAEEGATLIDTGLLFVRVQEGAFRVDYLLPNRVTLLSDAPDRPYQYDRGGTAIWQRLSHDARQRYYGLGEKAGPLDKSRQVWRMRNADALAYDAASSDPLYKHWPFYLTYDPQTQIAYGLLYDNLADTAFDLGREVNALRGGPYRTYQVNDGDLDVTLIFGPTVEEVLEKFAALTGPPVLTPRWSLGYLGSTMSYTEAPDTQRRLREFIALCQQHDIPCDGFQLSSGYTSDAEGRRQVFNWNTSKIPDAAQMVADFQAAGMRLAANIKPYLLRSNPQFDALAAEQGFVQAAADVGEGPEINTFWSGGLYSSEEGAYVDFTSAAGYDWWVRQTTEQLLSYGIAVLWNDNNEFEIWDDAARLNGWGTSLPAGQGRPLLTLLMGKASYEATAQAQPEARPWVLTRAGAPGLQRYAQTWSGDNETSWRTLQYNIPMGLSLSLSGMGNLGHDVGGFFGPKPEPELFVRWVQSGVFWPRFTIHSFNTDGSVNEPWMHPEVLPIIRQWLNFRYRLLPYLYTLLFEMSQRGHPMVRPTLYHYSADPATADQSFDFMLGENLLVATVYEPGARERAVYLPAKTADSSAAQWCDWYRGTWYAGGQTVTVPAPLDQIPLLATAGALIPMGKTMRHVHAETDDERVVMAFPRPEGGVSAFSLIEDDGWSRAAQHGAYSEIMLEMTASAHEITVAARWNRRDYPLRYDRVVFVLPLGETRPWAVADALDAWEDEQGRRHLAVPLT